jgi:hypothetical protein
MCRAWCCGAVVLCLVLSGEPAPPRDDRLGWRSGPGLAERTTAWSRRSGRQEVCGGSVDPSRPWFGTKDLAVCSTLPRLQGRVGRRAGCSEAAGRGAGSTSCDDSTAGREARGRAGGPAPDLVLAAGGVDTLQRERQGCRAAETPLGARPLEAAKFGARGYCGPTVIESNRRRRASLGRSPGANAAGVSQPPRDRREPSARGAPPALCLLPSAFCPLPSALCPLPSALSPETSPAQFSP